MNEMKKCRSCGREIPNDASFCPYCAGSQIEKEKVEFPRIRKRRMLYLLLIPLALLLVVLTVVLRNKPKTYEADGAELIYKEDGVTWHLLLRNDASDLLHWTAPQELFTRTLVRGTQGAIPLQLYVYREDTGENAKDAFAELLERSSVAVTADTGSEPASAGVPAWNPGFPDALLEADIIFNTSCSSNSISWTLNMKNGDTLVLHEKMEIHIRPEATYSYQNTPLTTMEELKALIEKADREVSKDAMITITLAPVVYEGDLVIEDRVISLVGTEEGSDRTTFTGTLFINAEDPHQASIRNILFRGHGTATGIQAAATFEAEDCIFEEYVVGVMECDGSSPVLSACRFERCSIGVCINSSNSIRRAPLISDGVFIGNTTAILMEQLPYDDTFYIISCTFTDNENDVVNHTDNKIEYMNSGG